MDLQPRDLHIQRFGDIALPRFTWTIALAGQSAPYRAASSWQQLEDRSPAASEVAVAEK